MSQNTEMADQLISQIQPKIENVELSGIKEILEQLSEAVAETINGIEEVETDINELENSMGEDPGIQISHLREEIRSLESRLERLERNKE